MLAKLPSWSQLIVGVPWDQTMADNIELEQPGLLKQISLLCVLPLQEVYGRTNL